MNFVQDLLHSNFDRIAGCCNDIEARSNSYVGDNVRCTGDNATVGGYYDNVESLRVVDAY